MKAYDQGKDALVQLKALYKTCKQPFIDDIDAIYDHNVVFKDPITEVRGLGELHAYLRKKFAGYSECRFEYLDELLVANRAFLKWNMHFRVPRHSSHLVTVRGVSQVHFAEKVIYHEDIYDLGAMVYEQLPVLGSVTRHLRRKIANKSLL